MEHLILTTTNGLGYSDNPFEFLTGDLQSASDEFYKHVGILLFNTKPVASTEEYPEQDIIEKLNFKSYTVDDHENNHAVHWYQNVKPNTLFIIDANYCSEIQVIEDCDFAETRELEGLEILEESYECITASIEDDEGQYTHYIFVK